MVVFPLGKFISFASVLTVVSYETWVLFMLIERPHVCDSILRVHMVLFGPTISVVPPHGWSSLTWAISKTWWPRIFRKYSSLWKVSKWCLLGFELGEWPRYFELTAWIWKPTLVLCTFYLVHMWRKHNDCQLHQKQFDCLHLILGMWWLEHFEHLWHCFLWFNRF